MKNNQYVQWIHAFEGKPTPKVGRGIPPPGTNMAIAIEHPPIFWLEIYIHRSQICLCFLYHE